MEDLRVSTQRNKRLCASFIAANYVMNCYSEYNILPEPTGLPEKAGKVVVTADISLAKVANVINMDIADLCMLNPQYRQGIVKTIGGSATLLLPSEKGEMFYRKFFSVVRKRRKFGEPKFENGGKGCGRSCTYPI